MMHYLRGSGDTIAPEVGGHCRSVGKEAGRSESRFLVAVTHYLNRRFSRMEQIPRIWFDPVGVGSEVKGFGPP